MKHKIETAKALGLAAITATMAAAVFTSCNKDDDLNNTQSQVLEGNEQNTETVAMNANPENLAENQHFGATITKNVPGYGDAEFTCISNAEPYYFVHVSKKEYTAKEMDAMDYQKNKMAVDREALDSIAKHTITYAHHILGKPAGNKNEMWTYEQGVKYLKVFEKIYGGLGNDDDGWFENITLESISYWIRNAQFEYPYANFEVTAFIKGGGSSKVTEDHYNMYLTAHSNHLMFYTVGHNNQSTPQQYKVGDTVKKTVKGYGEATFTCVSSEKPYYFVHVSDRQYSASEMDKMGFQQNEYAVTYELLRNLGDQALNMADPVLGKVNEKSMRYDENNCKAVINTLNPIFKIFGYSGRQGRSGRFSSQDVWVKCSLKDYPTGSIRLDFSYKNNEERNRHSSILASYYPTYLNTTANYLMFAFKVE